MANSSFDIQISRLRAFVQRDAKTIIRVEAVKHFKQSFRDEGFTDDTLEKWPDISGKRKAQKRKRNGNLPPILTDTGDLGNSITGEENSQGVTISSDKAYAQRHNEGLAGMPKRQFMGPSKALDRKIMAKLDKGIGKIFGRF
ncbi:phage virion morphogenesis protein [Spirosoma lituiforme]